MQNKTENTVNVIDAAKVAETTNKTLESIWNLAKTAYECSIWAVSNRPRLIHLALRSKKARVRKKNLRRIVREYIKEAKSQ